MSANHMKDPYQVLGVSRQADDKEIKKAYKRLAKELHPDRNAGDTVKEERFKEVKNAYEKIKTQQARQEFEQEEFAQKYGQQGGFGGQGFGGQSPFSGGGGEFHFSDGSDIDEDILRDIFGSFGMGGMGGGFRNARSRPNPKRDETAKVQLDFWNAVAGAKTYITLPNGSNLEVNIPAGTKSGQKLRLKGQASKINPASTGDLLLEVEVKSDPKAWRNGEDVTLVHDLPVDLAIEGGDSLVKSPLGNFHLKIPQYTDSGKKFRLKGKGPKGADLYVQINLVLPANRKEEIQRRFHGGAAA